MKKKDLLAFRARIRNLQRLGLAPSAPGRGKRLKYTFEDVCDLALALSLSDLGVDPLKIVEQIWSGTIKGLARDRDHYCVYRPGLFSKGAPEVGFCSKAYLQKSIAKTPRMAVVNIDDLKRRIREGLSAAEAEG